MKYLELPMEELINKFVEKLLITNRAFNFYVNWENAEAYKDFNIELHAMYTLIRCENFDFTFRKLLKKMPTAAATFPYLFALSKTERDIIWRGKEKMSVVNSSIGKDDNLEYSFSIYYLEKGLSDEQIEEYLFFFKSMGLKQRFRT